MVRATKVTKAKQAPDAGRPTIKYRAPVRLEPGETRSVPARDILELNETYLTIVHLMTYGLDDDGQLIEGEYVVAHQPLTLTQAARVTGERLGRARDMMRECGAFQTALNAALAARRRAEGPRNLETAIGIRDDEGDGTAATKAVRLKAIQSIEGTDRAGVNVTINNTLNQQNNVKAGYVLDLRSEGPTIEGEVVREPAR